MWVEDSSARAILVEDWDSLYFKFLFWQYTVFFFSFFFFESEKKSVGKVLEILQDLLDMDYVLQNTFLMK